CLPHWFPVPALANVLEHWLHPVVAMPEVVEHALVHEAPPVWLEFALMAASVGVAALGILLATTLYLWRTISPDRLSSFAGGGPYRLFLNKWYVDELYDATIVRGTLALTRLGAWFDRTIIDGIVDGAATLVRAVAWLEGR